MDEREGAEVNFVCPEKPPPRVRQHAASRIVDERDGETSEVPVMRSFLFLLAAVPSLCGLIKWCLWMRLVRHVHDRSGAEALKYLPPVARPFTALKSLPKHRATARKPSRRTDANTSNE